MSDYDESICKRHLVVSPHLVVVRVCACPDGRTSHLNSASCYVWRSKPAKLGDHQSSVEIPP